MTMARMLVAVRKWGRGRVRRGGALLLPASVLAFGVVGWEHLYHTLLLGHSESVAGHATHVLRDAALAIPIAVAALVGGLWLTRGLSRAAQAVGVSLVLGLLLVPATGLHDRIDAVLVTGGHHHEEGTSLLQLQHGFSDALVAMAVAPLLALFVLWLRGRDSSWVPGVQSQPLRHARPLALATASLLVLAMTPGSRDSIVAASSSTAVHDVHLTDNPGNWFDTGVNIAGTRSLLVVPPGDTINFIIEKPFTQTVHTVTSLAFPTGAVNMPFELPQAFTGSVQVTLTTPGLYVFLCELHPFMLGAVIVQDPATTPVLNLGKTLTLNTGATIPTASDLALRLVRAFFVITNPSNWQVFNRKNPSTWDPVYPAVPVLAFDQSGSPVSIANLNAFLRSYFHQPVTLPVATPPNVKGVGEVWIDTELELTANKTKPGTATSVNTASWQVSRKVALPSINFNNPHNMWASRDQSVIYNTQWFGTTITAFNRTTGQLLANTTVGQAPAHVMTRTDTDQLHVTLNGEDAVIELSPGATSINRRIPVQFPGERPAQPHAHWMGPDGHTMTTPNSNTDDSTLINVLAGTITSKVHTGTLPIATGMMPDASKYYVANYLDNTISVVSMAPPQHVIKTINLLANYDPISGAATGPIGAFPIQTPVSPNGKFVVTANTLTGTITIIDTATDTLVKSLPCDPGCHGVNFGAKKGGGYLAFVSSKFSNSLIVVDPDPNGNGNAADAVVVGRVVLNATSDTLTDDRVIANAGQGGMGVLPVPNVYNGWVQNVPNVQPFDQLTCQQRNPLGGGCP